MNTAMINTLAILGAEGPNGRWWPSDVKEFWWGAIAFGIVLALIIVKLVPLISKGLDDARATAASDAAAAEEAMMRSQAEATKLRNELGDADAAGQQLIAEAHESAAQVRADGAAKTQQAVADLRERSAADIASMKAQAQSDMQSELGVKAMSAAEAVVTANLDEGTQASLIEDYIAKIGAGA